MSGWKSLLLVCGTLAIAGSAQAQTSLFDPPPANSGAAPLTPPAGGGTTAAAPRAKPKAKGPTPVRVLNITNDSGAALTGLEISAEGKSATLAKELPTGKSATLRLPALKSCTVAISATFEGSPASDTHEHDICKDRKIRFTN